MTEHTEELYREAGRSCRSLKGLAETPTEDSSRINALAARFIETVGHMETHEANTDTNPSDLTDVLDDLADTLERTNIQFDDSKMANPLAGAQQRRWYDRERPEVVEALRRHRGAIAALGTAETFQNSTEG